MDIDKIDKQIDAKTLEHTRQRYRGLITYAEYLNDMAMMYIEALDDYNRQVAADKEESACVVIVASNNC